MRFLKILAASGKCSLCKPTNRLYIFLCCLSCTFISRQPCASCMLYTVTCILNQCCVFANAHYVCRQLLPVKVSLMLLRCGPGLYWAQCDKLGCSRTKHHVTPAAAHRGMNWQNLQGGVLCLKEVKLQPSSLPSPNASLAYATSMHRKDHSVIYIIDNCTNSRDACSTKVTWPDSFGESHQAGVQQGDAQYGPDMRPTKHQCRMLEPAQQR